MGPLGLGAVEYNSDLIRRYPGVVVTPGRKQKIIHGTHTFQVDIECGLTVYHAKLTISRMQRTQEDLQLCEDIEAIIEADLNWPDENGEPQVIAGFVTDVQPGALTRAKGDQVVASRMIVAARTQRRFK